jgi:hypothetical protein
MAAGEVCGRSLGRLWNLGMRFGKLDSAGYTQRKLRASNENDSYSQVTQSHHRRLPETYFLAVDKTEESEDGTG